MADTTFDTIVIGGGPGGSTTASLLSRGGLRVLVVEKEHFPRFHIGESLLPRSLPILNELGVDVEGPAFRYKGGAEFYDESTGEFARFPFAQALPGSTVPGFAYQVERASFDLALLERAEAAGATVHQGERVLDVQTDAREVRVRTDRATYTARYCVDASGQDAFFARRDRTTEPFGEFGRAAVFTHFEGLGEDGLSLFAEDGCIKVLLRPDGWCWLIPLSQGRLSVGIVTRVGKVTPERVDEAIASSPITQRAIAGARRLETRIIRNFSYKNTRPHGLRYACVGDAACFLDPVFSSGVALAMTGGEALAGRLLPAFEAGKEADPELLADVTKHMDVGYGCMSQLVYAFYNTHLVRNLFFAEKPRPEHRSGLISLLAGDVWRTDNAFQEMLVKSRRLKGIA
jgi:flavin-dependent dehydrogenase